MTKWIKEHRETIGILAVIGLALAAGIFVGFILILIANVIGIF